MFRMYDRDEAEGRRLFVLRREVRLLRAHEDEDLYGRPVRYPAGLVGFVVCMFLGPGRRRLVQVEFDAAASSLAAFAGPALAKLQPTGGARPLPGTKVLDPFAGDGEAAFGGGE